MICKLKQKMSSHSVTCHGTVVVLDVPINTYSQLWWAESAINKQSVFYKQYGHLKNVLFVFCPVPFKLASTSFVVVAVEVVVNSSKAQ